MLIIVMFMFRLLMFFLLKCGVSVLNVVLEGVLLGRWVSVLV